MPFIHDETEIDWPDDDSEPPPPRPDQFVYLPAPQFGGPSEPARFSIAPPAASEEPQPRQSGESAPSTETPRRGFLSRVFGGRNTAAAEQERRASRENLLRQQQSRQELWMQRLFAALIPALRASGARRAYCRYDGGHDEGFAWLDHYESDDGNRIDLTALSEQLFGMNVHDRLRDAGFKVHPTGQSKDDKIAELRGFASEWLAQEWASLMLGGSFGTGEYCMYGAFTVDLVECTVIDDAQADPVVQNIRIAS